MQRTNRSRINYRGRSGQLLCTRGKNPWYRIARVALWLSAVLLLPIATPTSARELNATQTEAVLLGGPWKATDTGAVYNYWFWNTDGTLCLKANDPKAEGCDDTGSWTRDGNKVCYELQWWGRVYGLDKGCFHVDEVESGYEIIDANGMTSLRFTILESQ